MREGNNFNLPHTPKGELGMRGLIRLVRTKPAQILFVSELVILVLFLLIISIILNSLHAPNYISAATSPDAIAIRVIPNPNHYSPIHWYQSQGFTGSPQSLTVDGYEAVRDGRTVYVNAANVDATNLYTNIYLISYNQNAESATVDIFGRILEHWKFNTNVAGTGYCSSGNGNISNCSGTIGCWHFDGDFKDYSGNGNDGSGKGSMTFTAGKIGQAADFDGSSYVDMGNSIKPAQFTLEAWVYYQGGGWQMVIGNEHSPTANVYVGFWLDIDDNDKAYFLIGDSTSFVPLHSTAPVPLNTWTHLASTYDGSNMYLYINGIKDPNTALATISYTNHMNNLNIGAGADWGFHYFNGYIDEVRIYNRALSASEIQDNYNQVYSQCLSDSECSSGGYCSSLKSRIIRDTKRLSELVEVKLKLAEFKQSNNHYPKLDSGTYLTNKTISVWPSWQETLAKELGAALPLDPINKLGACSGYDVITCWDEKNKKFYDPTPPPIDYDFNLPKFSNAYVYTTDAQGATYSICANMESGLISPTMGNCIGNVIANNPPIINGVNLPIIGSGKEYIGYVSATDPDGDILSWSIDTSGTAWVAAGWSAPPVLQLAGTNSQKKIYAAQTGNIGAYSFYITVSDGRGGSYTNPTAYQIIIGNCVDGDSDGYGSCPNCGVTNGCLKNGNDCDDAKNYINPGSAETCDNNDNNCNSQTDEGCDDDADDYCDNSMKFYNYPVSACLNSTLTNGSWGDDCDDSKNNIKPGATEDCGNGIDEDCNGSDLSCTTTCTDNDADGYGSPASTACTYATLDCNDNDASVNPGVPESGSAICNGIDNDCDGIIDEQCDMDNDNYCNCLNPFTPGSDLTQVCVGTNTTDPTSWTNTCDCNDNNISINPDPGTVEICTNNIDDDCDNDIDCADAECFAAPTCVATCTDNDADGYGSPASTACTYATLDCDDSNASMNPGAVENCTNSVDDNCDNDIDCADAQCVTNSACISACGDGACDVAGGECSSCAGDCTPAACCGNIIVDFTGEDCDDGNGINNDECTNSCVKTYCGDTVIQNNPYNGDGIAEQCDDGNTTAGDGCDANCQINLCYLKPAGMISWWPGDGNANDIQDSNNGVVNGSVGYITGKVGQAFNLGGVSYINVPNTPNLQMNAATGISFGAWFYPAVINQWGFVVNKTQGPGLGYALQYDNKKVRAYGSNSGCTNNSDPLEQTLSISAPKWIFAMVTISQGSPGTIKLYVDNTPPVSNSQVYHCTTTNDFKIGVNGTAAGPYYFEGYIDEAMFFNRELSAAEVQAIYDAGSYGICK